MTADASTQAELARLKAELADAQETLRAIRAGDVDAIFVEGASGPAVYALKTADSVYRTLVERMHEGALTVSAAGSILYCNDAFAKIMGRPLEFIRGKHLREITSGMMATDLASLLQVKGCAGIEIVIARHDGTHRDVFVSSGVCQIDGEAVHCLVVTDLTHQTLRLRHDAIVNASPDAIYSAGPDGTVETWNRGAEQLFGYTADEMIGQSIFMLSPPEQLPEVRRLFEAALHRAVQGEAVSVTKTGGRIDVEVSVAPSAAPGSAIFGVAGVARNITDRKRSQAHIRFLLGEMAHRSKNLLTIILAISRQMSRTTKTVEAFKKQLMERLLGLAASHDLLTSSDWTGVDLAQLAQHQLAPYVDVGLRFVLQGPDVFLRPSAAQNLGMAFNELATNAMKYGALSNASGTVSLTWEFVRDGVDRKLELLWSENGGPSVSPPKQFGFGHVVTEKLVSDALQAQVRTSYDSEGLRWAITVPESHLVVQQGPSVNGSDLSSHPSSSIGARVDEGAYNPMPNASLARDGKASTL